MAPDSPAFAALYSESPGRFLISVAPEHQDRVERHFQGQPLYLLGQVREDQALKITRDRRPLLKTTLAKLQRAWQQRFGNLV